MPKVKQSIKTLIQTHIKARYSGMALQTTEEKRALELIQEIADDPANLKRRIVYLGSVTKGLYNLNGGTPQVGDNLPDHVGILRQIEAIQNTDNPAPAIFVLQDFHEYIQNDPMTRRLLRDLHQLLKNKNSTLVLLSPSIEVPPELQECITVFDLQLPDKVELEDALCSRIAKLEEQEKKKRDELIHATPDKKPKIQTELESITKIKNNLSNQVKASKDQIVSALQGLTKQGADEVIAKCIVSGEINIETILMEKQQIVKKNGALDYWQTDETIDGIGGLKFLKLWARSARNRFSEKARQYGLTPPKGVLLVGAPGTGKTLSAKAISNLFGVPLLILTMAKMSSKYYGETGNRMIQAIKLAQAMSPCILLIDEIDKAFGSGGQGEHEESARTRGALLTAMEESEGIFFMATCNQPRMLAPELMARFPVIFHVDLPGDEERREIFAIHLKKIGRDPTNFDLDTLVSRSNGYVGREIRNALQEALGAAFDENGEINTNHILNALTKIIPTSQQREREIAEIRDWSKNNAQPANDNPAKSAKPQVSEDELNKDLEITP